jgi:flagellar motility protein MotE (MotC chaperone)
MSGKKYLVVLGILAVVSLGVSTGVTLLFGGKDAPPPGQGGAKKPLSPEEALRAELAAAGKARNVLPDQGRLEGLIKDLRARIAEYDRKALKLAERERRIATAEGNLQRRAKELEKLRMQLASPLTSLRSALAEYEAQMVTVRQTEKANFQQIAATYDKMESESAASIFTGMCEKKRNQFDDVVRILHYMSERTSAKVLSAMATTDAKTAADLTTGLQKVRELNQQG